MTEQYFFEKKNNYLNKYDTNDIYEEEDELIISLILFSDVSR